MLLPESTHALSVGRLLVGLSCGFMLRFARRCQPARATLTQHFTASAVLPFPSRLKGMRRGAGGNLRTWGKLCPRS